MKKVWETIKRLQRMDSTKPLMENNNNDRENGHEFERTTVHRNNGQTSQELLPFCSGEASDDAHSSSDCSESNSVQSNDNYTQTSILSFPDPPADLDQHLYEHLETIEEIVENEPKKLSHSMSEEDRTRLKNLFHCQACTHLNDLLQNISTSKNCSLLTNWVLQRKKQLDDPETALLDEWETKAKAKLLERVQEEVRDSLVEILRVDQSQTCHNEEDYVRLYVDLIQCIDAMPKLAQNISSIFYYRVQEVCFQELLNFVKRYTSEQTKILHEKARNWRENVENPEIIYFLKTLRTCIELRQHVQTNGNAIKPVLVKENKETLKNMEDETLQLLKKIATELAESYFKDYFKLTSSNCKFLPSHKPCKRECDLFEALKTHFPRLPYASDEQRIVMDEVYKIVAHSYLKHLIQQRKRKLTKTWCHNVGKAVWDDANELHSTISDLAPGVQQWHRMLLKIQEVSDCKSIDTLKLIIAGMQKDFEEQSEDLKLIPNLVQWKGLSKREVIEVLEALPNSPPIPSSGSLFSCCG